uniref:Putative secreted metalloprotease n=1 Tax=Ixodes ricinus TaxID=34613 RepID=A0A6B0VBD9_IXORI
MKVDSRLLILASTIFVVVCDSVDDSGAATTEDPYWTNVCEKAHRHHMGITIIADVLFQKEQAQTGLDQHLYLQTFVGTVNLYFFELRCSSVKLFLIKVVNSTTFDELKFEAFRSTTRSSGRSLDPYLTLGLFREWATNQSFFGDSDVVYLITGHPVFDFVLAYRLMMKAASYAFGVCSRRWRVALGSDDGKTFSGVPAAVQQIANLLGIKWDDQSYKLGCTPKDGHVMSRNGEPTQYPIFSECSKRSWDERTLMSLGEQSCYKLNLSSSESPSEGMTPYTFFNCSEPCQNISQRIENSVCNVLLGGTGDCKTGDICKISCCPDYGEHFNETKRGAPDGMPCGGAQVCLQQVCVKLPERRSEVSGVPRDSET